MSTQTTAAQESLAVPTASAGRKPWIITMGAAWRMRRTKLGMGIIVSVLMLAVLGPYAAPHSPTEFVAAPFATPGSTVWLGADYIGRDVLSRVLYGGRTVLALAFAATLIGVGLGAGLGLIAGYARKSIDEVIMRGLDVLLAFPSIILALLFVSIMGPELWLIVLMVGLSHMPRVARVARAATLEVAQRDFVRAAEALGVPKAKILLSEILPNMASPLLVEFGLRMTYSIGIIAALSFLGFGLQPPTADWGLMINENRVGIDIQPWAVLVPIALIGILTIGTNLIADGLGRALAGHDRETAE